MHPPHFYVHQFNAFCTCEENYQRQWSLSPCRCLLCLTNTRKPSFQTGFLSGEKNRRRVAQGPVLGSKYTRRQNGLFLIINICWGTHWMLTMAVEKTWWHPYTAAVAAAALYTSGSLYMLFVLPFHRHRCRSLFSLLLALWPALRSRPSWKLSRLVYSLSASSAH